MTIPNPQMRSYYEVTVREGEHNDKDDLTYNESIYSNWSDPVALPKIVVSSTPVILKTTAGDSILAYTGGTVKFLDNF